MSLADLLEAARADDPPRDRREAVWDEVARDVGIPAAAAASHATAQAGAPSLTPLGTLTTIALATLGTLVVAVGVRLPPGPAPHAGAQRAHVVAAARGVPDVQRAPAAPVSAAAATPIRRATTSPAANESARAAVTPPSRIVSTSKARNPEDRLAREAALVSRARSALVSGDPQTALALVREARRTGANALTPEEMSLEARALRALGRADEAAAVDVALRLSHPNHALVR